MLIPRYTPSLGGFISDSKLFIKYHFILPENGVNSGVNGRFVHLFEELSRTISWLCAKRLLEFDKNKRALNIDLSHFNIKFPINKGPQKATTLSLLCINMLARFSFGCPEAMGQIYEGTSPRKKGGGSPFSSRSFAGDLIILQPLLINKTNRTPKRRECSTYILIRWKPPPPCKSAVRWCAN